MISRMLGVLFLALGLWMLWVGIGNWREDRLHLRTWHRAEARVDSAKVVPVAHEYPYTLGGHGAALAVTIHWRGEKFSGWFVDPAWARRSRARAQRDANDAVARGTMQILIDPADSRHFSLRPDDALYFYRDAWQALLMGALFVVMGGMLRWRRRGTAETDAASV